MTPGELTAVRQRLEAFAAEVFAPLSRSDQRAKGQTYLRGLLLDGRRKSMQPMAERLGVDHQGLQQFVSSSTWAVEPVRERLARRAIEVIAPDAWVVDDTGFPKDGTASPGVARQYSGTLGKVGNCQVGVSISAVTDSASFPLDWRLFLAQRLGGAADGSLPAVWLLAEWPPEAAGPTDYWLASLPETTDLAELVRLAKIRWRIEHDYRECKTALGLDHFEGRTFDGWHRHVTLVTAAQLFLTVLRTDPEAAAPA